VGRVMGWVYLLGGRPVADMARVHLVIPPEPPVADSAMAATARSGQGRAAFWRGGAYPCRRAPLWQFARLDGRIRWDHEGLVNPAGELRGKGKKRDSKGGRNR